MIQFNDSLKIYFIFGGIFILNFILKSLFLTFNDIALDEPFSIFYAQMPISEIILTLKPGNNPPLWEILLHYWIKVFGIGVGSVRFLPLMFACLIPPVIYLLCNEFLNLRTALIASLLATFSTINTYYAHEARVYALFCLLSLLSVYFYLKLFKEGNSISALILLLSNTVLLYSHYLAGVVILMEFAGLIFIYNNQKESLKKFLILTAFTFLLFIPNLLVFLERLSDYSSGNTWVKRPEANEIYEVLRKFMNAPVATVLSFILIISMLFQFKKFINPERKKMINFILFWFFLPYLGLFLFSFKSSVFIDRYLLFLSIPYYILLAASVEPLYFRNKKVYFSIAGLIVLVMIVSYKINPSNKREPSKIVEKLKELKKTNTITFLCVPGKKVNYSYYYNRSYFQNYQQTDSLMAKEKFYPVNSVAEVSTKFNSAENVIYINDGSEFVDPNATIFQYLNSRFKNKETFSFKSNSTLTYFYN